MRDAIIAGGWAVASAGFILAIGVGWGLVACGLIAVVLGIFLVEAKAEAKVEAK